MRQGLLRAGGMVLPLLTLASFGILLSRTLELNGGQWATLFTDMRLALAVTHFGHIWWWRVPALLVLWIGWLWQYRGHHRGWLAALMLLAAAAIALTRSETGHPADQGDFTLAVWVDWAHLMAAGTWVGSLFAMSLVVFPRLLRGGERAIGSGAAMFQRLSTLSGMALAVLLACGIYNAIEQLGSMPALWTTRYGINLDVKIAIVLAMIAIGVHNRYVKLPRLLACAGLPAKPSFATRWLPWRSAGTHSASDALRSCARAVLAETLLGLLVIGATGVLLHAMPPTAEHHMQTAVQAVDPIVASVPLR